MSASGLGAEGEKADGAGKAESPLMKAAAPAVFAHVMVSFQSKARSGKWSGWNYSNRIVRNDPEALDEQGRPKVASVYYPLIGRYDMTDPHTAECHCQLAKMSGIDGFLFDLGFYYDPGTRTPTWRVEAMKRYADAMARYGLKAVVVYEDKANFMWNRHLKGRPETVAACHEGMDAWMKVIEKVQYRIAGRPVLMFFSYGEDVPGKGVGRLSGQEVAEWLERFKPADRPILATQWWQPPYKGIMNGWYDWTLMRHGPPPDGRDLRGWGTLDDVKELYEQRRSRIRRLLADGTLDLHMNCVYPGFDDRGCWGWGDGHRLVERSDGAVYRYTWEQAVSDSVPLVQIATWNDWFEGTNVEPSAEDGVKYLQITRDYAAKFKTTPPAKADLLLPIRVYRIRKTARDAATLKAMDEASELIRQGRYADAEKQVAPIARKLNVDAPKFWTVPKAD
ncbi:MAG TPA: hypothetical protein VFJ30_04070 [Phycisphaerae bacterium]|nr:hypothetical protein [Phycisphaerae bacterium]